MIFKDDIKNKSYGNKLLKKLLKNNIYTMDEISFDPSRYISRKSPSEDGSSKRKPRNSSTDTEFNVDQIRSALDNLKRNMDVPVQKASGKLKQEYDTIVRYETMLSNTSSYSLLEQLVDEKFGDVKIVNPGTIGAHFAGCVTETSFSQTSPGCSAVCAGAMPRKDRLWETCSSHVILAENKNDGFYFNHLSSGSDKSHAHIFINYESLSDFPGFSKEEKLHLIQKDIRKVSLFSYKHGDADYIKLTDDSVDISSIKTRKSHKHKHEHVNPSSKEETYGSWFWVIIAVIIFVILMLLLIYAVLYKD